MASEDVMTDKNRRCAHCGAAVSRQFVRVFGIDNAVHGCLECLTRAELAVGGAADRRVDGAGVSWRVGDSS